MSCNCASEKKRVYYATPLLFSETGPGGAGMQVGQVTITVCKECGEASFEIPEDKHRWFGIEI